MDKEVELILLKLKIVSEEQERGLYLCDKEHSKLLLDYITNLQEELETRRYDINNLTYQLAKEKEENKYLDELRNANYSSWQDSLSRIEKAVEYIKNDDNFWVALGEDCGKPNDDLDKLLNILNGRSDE